ncbi:MAG TPA: hypothetical protein VG672_01525 [Bryobacteraceae bacterium]|nr:hypothetical protein [Bryobacteraceae bacterium]
MATVISFVVEPPARTEAAFSFLSVVVFFALQNQELSFCPLPNPARIRRIAAKSEDFQYFQGVSFSFALP